MCFFFLFLGIQWDIQCELAPYDEIINFDIKSFEKNNMSSKLKMAKSIMGKYMSDEMLHQNHPLCKKKTLL